MNEASFDHAEGPPLVLSLAAVRWGRQLCPRLTTPTNYRPSPGMLHRLWSVIVMVQLVKTNYWVEIMTFLRRGLPST